MTNSQQEMIEYTTQDVIRYLVEDTGMTMEQAMKRFYLSETFKKLVDPETGLYLEESSYVYEMFKNSIKG